MSENHFTSIKTQVECGVLKREEFRDYLNGMTEEFSGYPLQFCYDEKPVYDGVMSNFIITLKGKPTEVEDMALEIDDMCRYYQICLHERLQMN